MKDDETKNIILLKDGLKELIESCPDIFNFFVKNKLKKFAAKEEHIDYKNFSKDSFFLWLQFFRKIWHALQVFNKFNCKQSKHKYSKGWWKIFCI